MVATQYAGFFGPEVIVDDDGRPITRVPVEAFTVDSSFEPTSTHATLYAKHDRSVSLANPMPQDVGDDQYGLDQHGNVSFLADVAVLWLQWTQAGITRGKRVFVQRHPLEPSSYGGDWVLHGFYPAGSLVNVPGTPNTMWVSRRDVLDSGSTPAAGADWAAVPPAGPKGDPGPGPTSDAIDASVAAYLIANPPPVVTSKWRP